MEKARLGTLTSTRLEIEKIKPIYDEMSEYISRYSHFSGTRCKGSFLPELDDTDIVASRIRRFIMIDMVSCCNDPRDLRLECNARLFDDFRTKFLLNIQSMSPRTAWEEAILDATKQIRDPKRGLLVRNFMTLANEIYHVIAAATISAQHGIEVKVETAYSRRMNRYIQYKPTDDLKSEFQSIKVPIREIMKNRSSFVDELFGQTHLSSDRKRYISNCNETIFVKAYEKQLFSSLNLAESLLEKKTSRKEDVAEYTEYGMIAIEATSALYFSNSVDKKYLASMSATRRSVTRSLLMAVGTGLLDGARKVVLGKVPAISGSVASSDSIVVTNADGEMLDSRMPPELYTPYNTRPRMPTALTYMSLNFSRENLINWSKNP